MNTTSKALIFFGTEDFSLTALTGLIEAGYEIAAVVTKPDSKKGRGQKLTPPRVKVVATQHNIPVWQPDRLADIIPQLIQLQPVAGVLVSYGKIIPQTVINLFEPGIINVHPSLLPKYRGPSPIESAIKNQDSSTGVSIMQLSATMDTGPVYAQVGHQLQGTETRPELYHALADVGTDLLLETLPRILDGSLQPQPQDEMAATYSHLLQKTDIHPNLSELSAQQAEALVRAHLGFPKTKVVLFDQTCVITKAHVSTQQKTPLDLICQDDVFLSIDELIAPSGKTMTGEAFLHGYTSR